MEDRKKVLILGAIILIMILCLAVFFIYKVAYKKGADDQFQILMSGMIQSATNCQPISIELNEGNIQLVNPLCYQGAENE